MFNLWEGVVTAADSRVEMWTISKLGNEERVWLSVNFCLFCVNIGISAGNLILYLEQVVRRLELTRPQIDVRLRPNL